MPINKINIKRVIYLRQVEIGLLPPKTGKPFTN